MQRISIKKDVTMYKKRILDKLLERKLKRCGAGARDILSVCQNDFPHTLLHLLLYQSPAAKV